MHHDLVDINWDTAEVTLLERLAPNQSWLERLERYTHDKTFHAVVVAPPHEDEDCPFWREDRIKLGADYDPWKGRPDAA